MKFLLETSKLFNVPPPGSVNVVRGKVVNGPGGQWVPCATKVSHGVYYPGIFRVGRGSRQVCKGVPHGTPHGAILEATELAAAAAA